jgi:adenine deaminase
MMNVPGVLNNNAEVLAKLAVAHRHGVPVDGHGPGLRGNDAARYAAAGITTDHECTTLTEAEDKLRAGISILIREGSAARDFEALHPLISTWPDQVMFCSDDKHPDDLLEGHINSLLARAVAHGHDLFDAVRCATLNPVHHYQLPVGLLRVGDSMDAVAVRDLTSFAVDSTWIAGQRVADQGRSLLPPVAVDRVNQFTACPINAADLVLPAPPGESPLQIRVIKAVDGELITPEVIRTAQVQDFQLVADASRDLLWLVVVNRYQPSPPAVAFVEGFGLREGALASSVAHDSHNIVAVGASTDELCQAVNGVIAERGGIALAAGGELSVLPLPVAGLMSDRDGDFVGAAYQTLNQKAISLGSPLRAPFMTLSFMALLVIPELKLSDQGLFDGRRFALTKLILSR